MHTHAQRWIAAAGITSPHGRERIENLLQNRRKYLGLPQRQIIWCSSAENLQERLSQESSISLIYEWEKFLRPFIKNLEKQLSKQLKERSLKQLQTDIMKPLGENYQLCSLINYQKIRSHIREALWIIQEKKGYDSRFVGIYESWQFLFDLSLVAYCDCLWQCLPDKTKIRNYFHNFGEAYEAGLGLYIPSKTKEYLLANPNRSFADAAILKDAPHINWPEMMQQTQALENDDTNDVLHKLALFREKLGQKFIPESIVSEVSGIIELINKLLPLLKKEHPGIALTFEVKRIANDYLLELMESYLGLSEENRTSKQKTLLEILRMLREELVGALNHIEDKKADEFEIVAEFLRQTFRPSSLEI